MATLLDLSLGGQSASIALVAKAGGGQALATPLPSAINSIGTCATGADSVMLPIASAGAIVFVANDGAASAQVFGNVTSLDTINAVATATGVALANTKRGLYFCTVGAISTPGAAGAAATWTPGKWVLLLTA